MKPKRSPGFIGLCAFRAQECDDSTQVVELLMDLGPRSSRGGTRSKISTRCLAASLEAWPRTRVWVLDLGVG